MDDEKQAILQALAKPNVQDLLNAWYKQPTNKVSFASVNARQKGKALYRRYGHNSQEHEKIWKFYSQSIASAPLKSNELGLAYASRSELLFHLNKFDESIIDINRALKFCSDWESVEILRRREKKCVAALAEIKATDTKLSSAEKQNKDDLSNNVIDATKDLSLNEEKYLKNVSDITSNDRFNFSKNTEEDKAKIEEILSKKKTADPYDIVSIDYNENFGRHLKANRYIKPGEIIIIVEPYVKCLNLNNMYAFCGHCLKTSWTSIPCDYCNWCMFCSEECKEEAWKQYHDIECSVIPYISFNQVSDYWKQLALRLTIKAIREAGSIKKLQEELKLIDGCKIKLQKGFLNGKFHNDRFQSIYSLSHNISKDTLIEHIDHAVLSLIILAKSTDIFGKNVKFTNTLDLISNEDVIFVGSLILKFLKISDINAHCVMEGMSLCRFRKSESQCYEDRCCERGACIAPIPSLLNHSCDPNIRKCFTEDMYLIVYAQQPIKKDSQLFDCYAGSYFQTPLEQRQLKMKEFNFICNCPPCKKKWSTILFENKKFVEKSNLDLCQQLLDKYKSLFESLSNAHAHYCLNTLDYLSEDIEKATSNLKQPSYITAKLIASLGKVFDHIYSMKLQITDKCN